MINIPVNRPVNNPVNMELTSALGFGNPVAAILRKYGTDAHVYLPGIGVINGLTAGNYLDSAGTTAATVDNPVGLVLDGAGSVGPELVTNGGFNTDTAWDKTNVTISGGVANLSASASLLQVAAISVGKLYKTEYTISDIVAGGGNIKIYVGSTGAGTARTTNGTFTEYIYCSGALAIYFFTGASFVSGKIDNISVKEVTGIHATQATTANKPVLRMTNGRYWWDMVDGTDLLTATFPAGYESVTTIDAAPTGQVTLTAQNIVGAYAINTDTYGRFVFKSLTASELATMQAFANRLVGL